VEGADNKAIYSGKQAESEYHVPARAAAGAATPRSTNATRSAETPAVQTAGKKLYETYCMGCHQSEGQGIPGTFPPLAKSDYLMGDKSRVIETVLNGLTGHIEVNGRGYDGVMPPMGHLKDEEISEILNYIRHSWGNEGDTVSPEDVAAARSKTRH
jgi:nitrite reductase (NO-forming)